LIPRREVRVSGNNLPLYYGYIDDFSLSYTPDGRSTVELDCVDGFSNLANAVIPETIVSAELSSDRVETILDLPEVAWGSTKRVIDTGTVTVKAETIPDNTNALSYLKEVSESEFGNLFIDKSGDLNFQGSSFSPFNPDLAFTDDNSVAETYKIPFAKVGVSYGTEFLFNRIVLSNGVDTVEVSDTISQGLYGVRTYENNSLLNNSSASLTTLANSLLATWKAPRYRFEQISVRLERLSPTNQDAVLDLEIGDLVSVYFTPNQIPPAIEQDCRIVGISHSWDLNSQIVNFSVEPFGAGSTVFILDSATSGILDTSTLG